MKQNFFKRFISKIIAKQLRKPSGLLAGKVGNEMNKTNRFLYDFTIKAMEIKDYQTILEIGFGNGIFFNQVFSAANNLQIAGLDFSKEMVKAATRNNVTNIDAGKLSLQAGSSDKIPFRDNSFDKVFCINVIYFWEQPADHLREIYRVLKPGGKFYTSIRTKESLEKMPFSKYGFHIYSQDEWINLLEVNRLQFTRTVESENEPDAVIDKQAYKAGSLCIVAEKK